MSSFEYLLVAGCVIGALAAAFDPSAAAGLSATLATAVGALVATLASSITTALGG